MFVCRMDVVAPAMRCLYCERCGLFLGTFVDTRAHAPFSCAFTPGSHCLCTLPSDALCALLGDVESQRASALAKGRLQEAFYAAGCDAEQASVAASKFLPLSPPVRAWLLRHLKARMFQPGNWQN